MPCDIWWTPIRHAAYAYQLYLVSRARQEEDLVCGDQ
jgi:hypothetical protein